MPEWFVNCGWMAFVILFLALVSLGASALGLLLGFLRKTLPAVLFSVVGLLAAFGSIGGGGAGMMLGRSVTDDALSGDSVDPSQRERIRQLGYAEAESCLAVGGGFGAFPLLFGLVATAVALLRRGKKAPTPGQAIGQYKVVHHPAAKKVVLTLNPATPRDQIRFLALYLDKNFKRWTKEGWGEDHATPLAGSVRAAALALSQGSQAPALTDWSVAEAWDHGGAEPLILSGTVNERAVSLSEPMGFPEDKGAVASEGCKAIIAHALGTFPPTERTMLIQVLASQTAVYEQKGHKAQPYEASVLALTAVGMG